MCKDSTNRYSIFIAMVLELMKQKSSSPSKDRREFAVQTAAVLQQVNVDVVLHLADVEH
jgi:hypothetical protein